MRRFIILFIFLILSSLALSGCAKSVKELNDSFNRIIPFFLDNVRYLVAVLAFIVGLVMVQQAIVSYFTEDNRYVVSRIIYGFIVIFAAIFIAFLIDSEYFKSLLTTAPPG